MYQNNLTILNELIKSQQKSFRQYLVYTFCILALGFIILIIAQLIAEGTSKTIATSGGTFITSLSGFSLKEYFNKKGNIKTYDMIKLNIELNKENENEQLSIKNLLQNIIIKNL